MHTSVFVIFCLTVGIAPSRKKAGSTTGQIEECLFTDEGEERGNNNTNAIVQPAAVIAPTVTVSRAVVRVILIVVRVILIVIRVIAVRNVIDSRFVVPIGASGSNHACDDRLFLENAGKNVGKQQNNYYVYDVFELRCERLVVYKHASPKFSIENEVLKNRIFMVDLWEVPNLLLRQLPTSLSDVLVYYNETLDLSGRPDEGKLGVHARVGLVLSDRATIDTPHGQRTQ
ncbi:hypothetical protein F5148DRAFT_1375712 [Russula earlei]|uniref:Uncharacterized protein n=1 Tax=Russula earlei TaxID=71964 RepID=A0ACC0UC16_9AGAM|nr:hypothetical protein F5148DRAFT_1375712 [Russula earlei]